MSAEDEADWDLYGDDDDDGHVEEKHPVEAHADSELHERQQIQPRTHNGLSTETPEEPAEPVHPTPSATDQPSLKRKSQDSQEIAPANEHHQRLRDPDAQASLKLSELQWWITEEDLRGYCARANAEEELMEVAFAEHKINGKSRGEAYLQFETPEAASMVKRELDKVNAEIDASGKASGAIGNTKVSVWYTSPGNPFKARDSAAKKEIGGRFNNQQSYNNQSSRGGPGRGRGGYHAGRGGSANGAQWGMQSGGQTNGFNNNSMMNGFGFGGFGGMAMHPAMMNSMMGMAGMSMAMPQMLAGRGGNTVNRGGRGGYPQQQQQQPGGYGQGWESNKKPRKE